MKKILPILKLLEIFSAAQKSFGGAWSIISTVVLCYVKKEFSLFPMSLK
jgi:hypothetical protein